ncbi:MAG: SDR family NAD(P)-dependent oxidoreductase [Chloroflexi bacterium]|nr:SDR family NAD(P)-dependent oxidoreductase [Chloroflexota bacterium]
MTTFITGGTSSIGRVLVKELASSGETVRVLARSSSNRTGLELPGVDFVSGDVTDKDAVHRGMEDCERVCHLAAVVGQHVSESEWWSVNRDGSRNVLQAAHDLGVKSMVQVSSISVLGSTAPGEIADETRPIDPTKHLNMYQKTKFAADQVAREYAGKGLRVMIVYPGFGYGYSWASSHPSMQETTLLRLAVNKPVAILGTGKNKLCPTYYNDTVQGIRLAFEHGKAGDDYILCGETLTFVEIWDRIAKVLHKAPPRRRIPAGLIRFVMQASIKLTGKSVVPSEIIEMIDMNWDFCADKAKRDIGWRPHTFLDGIAETWAAYQAGSPKG